MHAGRQGLTLIWTSLTSAGRFDTMIFSAVAEGVAAGFAAAAAGAARSQLAAVPGLDRLRRDKEGGRSECCNSSMVEMN